MFDIVSNLHPSLIFKGHRSKGRLLALLVILYVDENDKCCNLLLNGIIYDRKSFIVDATAYYTVVYLTRIGKFYSTDPKCNLIKFVSEIPEQCRYLYNKFATTKLFN
jgi:hypothetical protein